MSTDPCCELLTVEQFAARLQISRATVFALIKRGVLVDGRHLIRLGRVVRFPWSAELVAELLKTTVEQHVPTPRPQRSIRPRRTATGSPVNWDY
jgi:predicted DNA-binding transcriptional regulator AlpA